MAIRGALKSLINVPTGTAILLLNANPNRAGIFIEANAGNAGNIALGFDDPSVSITAGSSKQGILLAATNQYVEQPPSVFTGAIYVVSTNGTEDMIYREDYQVTD